MPSTKPNLGISELRVGIFVLFGLAVLGFLILNSTGDFNPFKDTMRVKARFKSADGLREGAEVQLAGVNIGRVEEVRLLPPDSPEDAKIEAIMIIDQQLGGQPISERIRSDSTAQLIATSVLANDKIINISPGTQDALPIRENGVLDSSEAISINQLTQTGNDLLQQINKLAIPTNEILNKANRGEGTLGNIINDESLYRNLDATVGETKLTMLRLQTILERVKSGDGTAGKLLNDPALYNNLNKTVAELESISKDLRSGRGTAGKFLTDEQIYNETKQAISELRNSNKKIDLVLDDVRLITTDLKNGRGTAGKFLSDDKLYNDAQTAIARLNATTTKFETLIADVQNGKGTIGKLFTDETLYRNLNQTSSNINQLSSESTKLIYDFRQNPKKYLTIKFELF